MQLFLLLAFALGAAMEPRPSMEGVVQPPTRQGVATALYERFVLRNDTGVRALIGLIGSAGAPGRSRPSVSYINKLANCKVVVTCNPTGWEGDSRLGEALISGALVLSDRMLDVPPGLVPGENVLFYNSSADMLAQVEAALAHPAESARIAARGSEGASTYVQLIERVLLETGLLPPGGGDRPRKLAKADRVPILLAVPANAMRRGETWGPLEQALRASEVARPEPNASLAHALLIDQVMIEPGRRRFFKGRGGVRQFLDPLWPLVQQARSLNSSGPAGSAEGAARQVNGTRLPIVIGLDFCDAPNMVPGHDQRIDVIFKRSRVWRAQRTWTELGLSVHALHYPVKPVVYNTMARYRATVGNWSSRPHDVCCFFPPVVAKPDASPPVGRSKAAAVGPPPAKTVAAKGGNSSRVLEPAVVATMAGEANTKAVRKRL